MLTNLEPDDSLSDNNSSGDILHDENLSSLSSDKLTTTSMRISSWACILCPPGFNPDHPSDITINSFTRIESPLTVLRTFDRNIIPQSYTTPIPNMNSPIFTSFRLSPKFAPPLPLNPTHVHVTPPILSPHPTPAQPWPRPAHHLPPPPPPHPHPPPSPPPPPPPLSARKHTKATQVS